MATARLLAALLLFLSILAPAEMQAADFADCAGVVLDENGVPVGAAQVKFENSSSQVLRAETDSAGRFMLRRFPAGDYKVEVRKTAFFLPTGQPFTVRPGTNELTLSMNHAQAFHEQVQVTAPSNQIDTQDTAQRSTLSARGIRDIPVPNSHVLAESLVALPEIVRDHRNNLHIAGARSGDTQYLLDGFEIGDPVSGALTSRFNIDATRAAEVQTARVGANYAHSGAGILSLETPDGDDRWRFGTTNPVPGINIQQGVHLGNWYPRFTFSGPIERGRFWFPKRSARSIRSTWSNSCPRASTLPKSGRATICSGSNITCRQSTFCAPAFSITAPTTATSDWTRSIRSRRLSMPISAARSSH